MTDSERKAFKGEIARLKSELSDLSYKCARQVEQNIKLLDIIKRLESREN